MKVNGIDMDNSNSKNEIQDVLEAKKNSNNLANCKMYKDIINPQDSDAMIEKNFKNIDIQKPLPFTTKNGQCILSDITISKQKVAAYTQSTSKCGFQDD